MMLFNGSLDNECEWAALPSSLASSASILGEAEATAKSTVSQAELESFEVDDSLSESARVMYLLKHGNDRQKAAGLRYLTLLDESDVGPGFSEEVAQTIISYVFGRGPELVLDALDCIGIMAYGDKSSQRDHWLFHSVHSHSACAARAWLQDTKQQGQEKRGRRTVLTQRTLRATVLPSVLKILEKDLKTAPLSSRLAIAILINDCAAAGGASGVEVRQALATATRVARKLGDPGSQPASRRVRGCQLLGAICASLGRTPTARSRVEHFLELALGLCQDTEKEVRVAMCQELPAFFASHGGGDKIIDELSELLRDEESEVALSATVSLLTVLEETQIGDEHANLSKVIEQAVGVLKSAFDPEKLVLPGRGVSAEDFQASPSPRQRLLPMKSHQNQQQHKELQQIQMTQKQRRQQKSREPTSIPRWRLQVASKIAGVPIYHDTSATLSTLTSLPQLLAFLLPQVSVLTSATLEGASKGRKKEEEPSVTSAKKLPSLRAPGRDGSRRQLKLPAKTLDLFVRSFNLLMRSGSVHNRIECARHFPSILRSLESMPCAHLVAGLQDSFATTADDPAKEVRQAAALSLKMLVASSPSCANLSFVMLKMSSDTLTTVQRNALQCIPNVISAKLSSSSPASLSSAKSLSSQLIERIHAFSKKSEVEQSWRSQVELLAAVTEALPSFPDEQRGIFLFPFFFDHAVSSSPRPQRVAMRGLCKCIQLERIRERREKMLDTVRVQILESKKSRLRCLILPLVEAAVDIFSHRFIKTLYMEHTIRAASDSVVGVRLAACATFPLLKSILRFPREASTLDKIQSAAEAMIRDESPCVSQFAVETVRAMGEIDAMRPFDSDEIKSNKEKEGLEDMVISESSSKPQRRRSLHASNIKDALDQLRGSSLKSSSLQPFKTSPLKIGTTTSSIPSSSSPLSSSSPSSLPLYSSSLSSSLSSSALPKIGSKRIQTMKDFQQGMSQAARLISGNKGLRFGLRSGKSKGKGGRRRSTFDSVSSWRKRIEKSNQSSFSTAVPSYIVHGAESPSTVSFTMEKGRRAVSARVRGTGAGLDSINVHSTRRRLLATSGMANVSQSSFSGTALSSSGHKGKLASLEKR